MGVHGIISYGAYIPRGCLLRSSIVEFTGKGSNKGSRSVASYDATERVPSPEPFPVNSTIDERDKHPLGM